MTQAESRFVARLIPATVHFEELCYMVIRHRHTKKGVASDLDFWWQKARYRPCLGISLDSAQEVIAAGRAVALIKSGLLNTGSAPLLGGETIASFTPSYMIELRAREVVDLVRPEKIIETHLVPSFPQPMSSITFQEGQAYIAQRRAAGAADGTIGREWNVLLSILTCAVRNHVLKSNPLSGVTPPKSGVRERMPTAVELVSIEAVSSEYLWRAAVVAMHCGLREEKLWAIRGSWIVQKPDGPWLQLPPPRSKKKGNPTWLPLNRFAYAALAAGLPASPDGRVFTVWADKHALGKAWARATDSARVEDLNFHDLRRFFASGLENLGDGEDEEAVPREVVKYLLGHQPADTLERHYLVRSKGWEKKLRRAVDQLADRYEQSLAEGQALRPPVPSFSVKSRIRKGKAST